MRVVSFILAVCLATGAIAGEITIQCPEPVQWAKAGGAEARVERNLAHLSADAGKVISPEVMLRSGVRLVGVDMNWYAVVPPEGAKPDELSDEDRKEVGEICGIPSFYDRCEILLLSGNADRAVALMQLVRDRDFHAGKGEVIWRAELWYFEFQNGGWAKVSQQNQVLDRQRFASREKYLEHVRPIRFLPKLGGIIGKEGEIKVELTADDIANAAKCSDPKGQ